MSPATFATLVWVGAILLMLSMLAYVVRVSLIARLRNRRMKDIQRLTAVKCLQALLAFRQGPDFDAMVWDLRKWTYRQFYPQPL